MKPMLPRISYGLIGFLAIVGLLCTGSALADAYTTLAVTPNGISFTVASDSSGQSQGYYEADQAITVASAQRYLPVGPWTLGIRAGGAYLVDATNPANRIPITQLRWSKDGRNFFRLSQQWAEVAAYRGALDCERRETITYRLYAEGAPLPAGNFTVQIDMDARIQGLPWAN